MAKSAVKKQRSLRERAEPNGHRPHMPGEDLVLRMISISPKQDSALIQLAEKERTTKNEIIREILARELCEV